MLWRTPYNKSLTNVQYDPNVAPSCKYVNICAERNRGSGDTTMTNPYGWVLKWSDSLSILLGADLNIPQ